MRKVLTITAIAAGAALAAAGAAHAEPAADPDQYSDVTAAFVDGLGPGALEAGNEGKQLIVSPYGTSRTIACRGDGDTVAYYDCKQEDDLGWIDLRPTEVPGLGPAWVYLP
ncbi:MAG TPA: hypothetical protein VK083_07005 [Nocardia sp.]|uniref:hypothetical protein n=1 Tax=Nocardia TaxID=1817 RepID=UPI00245566E5|nr:MULTISPECIES: hypothetical protein [Nocardia]HLS76521.1 hypothetical protein [Nocardia sp.]